MQYTHHNNKLSDLSGRNGSPPVSGSIASVFHHHHHHHHHKAALSSFAFFVRAATLGLLLVGCLLIHFATPFKGPKNVALKSNSAASSLERREEVTDLNEIITTTNSNDNNKKKHKKAYANIDLELPLFPTLKKELDRSDVVVLYFAAKWCKMSNPITKLIDEHLMSTLQASARLPADQKRPFSLIYVSSDNTKAQYKNYNQMRSWTKVPFQNSPERRNLKRYFKVCAKIELEKLQIQREHELPFLVVLSGKTHRIVSKRGVEDLKKLKFGVLEHWQKLVLEDRNSVNNKNKNGEAAGAS